MELKITDKIPLLRIRSKRTAERMMRIHANKQCLLYSEAEKGFKRGDDWVSDLNMADALTFSEWYEKTKDEKSDVIVYCIVKI